MNIKHINLQDFSNKDLKENDLTYLSGFVYTARDAAHKKLQQIHNDNQKMPIKILGSAVYYVGACPPKDGEIIGSCGPTTSLRMDFFTPELIKLGLKAIIGKGKRNSETTHAIKNSSAVYFTAFGGAGAYYVDCIKSQKLICFPELLSEAIYEFELKDFPAVVSIVGEK